MPVPRDAFVTHCAELLSAAGAVRSRRMFGGHGLYVDELFVAIVAFGRLYLKVDAASRGAFEAAGGAAFVYPSDGRPISMNYFSAPEDAMESPALMKPWARLALDAALRARALKPPAPRRRSAATPAARAAKPAKVTARSRSGKA